MSLRYVHTTAFLSVTHNVNRFKQRFYAPENLVALHTQVAEKEKSFDVHLKKEWGAPRF
jgi:hypothetical protein